MTRPLARNHSGARRTTACLLSSHPLALASLQQALSGASVRVLSRLVNLSMVRNADARDIPRASVYVLDGQSLGAAAEQFISGLRREKSSLRSIVLLPDLDDAHTFPLIHAGAKGLIRLDDAAEQLARAVPFVAQGGIWIPRKIMAHYLEIAQGGMRGQSQLGENKHLSRREREVLQLLLKNFSNKEIANELHISESTVKFHVSNIFSRFGVQRRADLILQSVQEQTLVQ